MQMTTAWLRRISSLLLGLGLSLPLLPAQTIDQTVTGSLSVMGDTDLGGNILSFGTLRDNATTAGVIQTFGDGPTPTLTLSAARSGTTWLWQSAASPQLKLDSTNTLSLFAPGSALPAITLNPAGTSVFSQGLTVTGTLTATGGLASPNGIVTGGATGLSLQAGGTGNQNITLVPTGTGVTTTASPVTVTNATASSSTTTGALVVTGGVGVNGTLTAGNVTTGGTVNAGTLKVTNVDTSLTNLGLGSTNIANFGAINAADPSFFYPAPVAKVSHTATTGPFLSAPQVVTLAGNFAYVGSSASTSFQILDITNPLLPVKRGALVGTGGAAAKLSFPRGIAISGSYAYVTSQTDNALQVINIANPDAPVAAGSLLNGVGGAVLSAPYGIAIAGNYAYIASSGSKALEIVNISNPAAPVHAGQLTNATWLNGARAVAVAGNYAYVVSTTGGSLAVVNVSNPAAPTLAATLGHNAAGPLLLGPTAIAISGNYAYVTSASSNALQIIDISNPLKPVGKGSLVNGTAGAQLSTPSALTVVGTTAFVTVTGTTKALQIVDVSNPLAPTPKGQLLDGSGGALLNGPTSIAVSGNYAFVTAASSSALQVLSLASGGGYQIKNTTVLTTDAANNLLLGSGLPTGKVAIGTTNATSRLTVAGTDTTAASSVVNFTDSTGKSLLFVQNDGKVGIGTATPTAKLDVVGDAKVSGTLTVGGQPVVTANQLGNYTTTAQVATQLAPYAKPTTLYNTAGTAVSSVGADGKVNFTNGLSVGTGSTASGLHAIAMGSSTASGYASTAIGSKTTASGYNSIAMGEWTSAIGSFSIAMGEWTSANGMASTATGSETAAGGEYSTAMGRGTAASGHASTAMGYLTLAQGQFSTTIGQETEAYASHATVIGRLNIPQGDPFNWVPTDDLFVIGNGYHQNYDDFSEIINSNAFVVKKNGDTFIQGNLGIGTPTPTAKLDVAGDAVVSGSLTVGGKAVVTASTLMTGLAPYAKSADVTTQLAPYLLSTGSGAGLTSLNASALTTGTLPAARIAAASLPWTTLTGKPTTVAGYGITDALTATSALNASQLTTGTLPVARIAAASVTNDKLATNPLARANHTGTQDWTTTISGKPTTLAGYGITNGLTTTGIGTGLTALNATQITNGTLPIARIAAASVTNDKLTTNPLARANHTGTQAWSTLTATPTTVAGYGITDAVQKTATGDITVTGATALQGSATLNGSVTVNAPMTVNRRVAKLRVDPQGDLSMGDFEAGKDTP